MFGASARRDDDLFDAYDAFVPGHLPDPGGFLDGHDVLAGDAHAAFHRLTRELFEERGVYDVTFGYNLARLNLDRRHDDAGFRYAVDADDPTTLRAEFTPTTEFCPQSEQLTVGAFRAWNALADRHEYDRVRVRVADMHQDADAINGVLEGLAERLADGDVEGVLEGRTEGDDGGPGVEGSDGSTTGFESPF